MEFTQVENLMRNIVLEILQDSIHPACVRLTYGADGQPGFKHHETVVFIRLMEREDDISIQRDVVYSYDNIADTVLKQVARTRVWESAFNVYGPNAHKIINQIKDGVLLQRVKRLTNQNNLFLIPRLAIPKRVPELFSGQWWNRWDLALTWNELYKPKTEDVGRIVEVPIYTKSENTR